MDLNTPVVNVGSRIQPSYLPAEACMVVKGQASGKKLTPDQTRTMIEFACRRPKANADSIVGDGRKVLALTPPDNTVLVCDPKRHFWFHNLIIIDSLWPLCGRLLDHRPSSCSTSPNY